MSTKVFISHAAADTVLAESLQDLLDYGIGIPRNDVFRSSDSDSITTGHFFVQTILQQLVSAEYVACIITPLYLQRPFCLAARGLTPNNSGAANGESMLAKRSGWALRKARRRTSGDV
jgi:hypothetical protein